MIKTKYVLRQSYQDCWEDIIDDTRKSEILKKRDRLLELHPELILKIFRVEYEIIYNVISETLVKDE